MRNKFLKGVTSLGIAAAICMAFGAVSASAATILDDGSTAVDVHYRDQKIKVYPSSTSTDKQILFGVSTVKKKSGNQVLNTSAWEVYDIETDEDGEKSVTIDISSLNTQKGGYVQIKGDQSKDPITLHIKPSDSKVKMSFDVVNGTVVPKKNSTEKPGVLEYRTQYGDWEIYGTYAGDSDEWPSGGYEDMDDVNPDDPTKPAEDDNKIKGKLDSVDLSVYQQRGATLYFREASDAYWEEIQGEAKEDGSVTVGKPSTDVKDAEGEAIPNCFELSALPGKEVKVAVGKKANGPKATVDYLKHTIKIPKNAKYRVNKAGELGKYSESTGTAVKTLNAKDIQEAGLFGDAVLELYTVDPNGKKADSKVTQVEFTAKAETKFNIDEPTLDAAKKKLTVKNKSEVDTYEVVVSAEQPAVGAKGTAIKPGATKVISKVDDIEKVWIHVVGDKKAGVWSTDFVKLNGTGGSTTTEPTEQDKLKTLGDELFVKSVDLDAAASKGDAISIINSTQTQTVDWNNAATYQLADGKSIEGVTITISVDENDVVKLGTDGTSLEYAMKGSAIETETGVITVTLSKTDCTNVVLSITCAKPAA